MSDETNPKPEDADTGESAADAARRPLDEAEILARLEESLADEAPTSVNPVDACAHDWYDLGFVPSGNGLMCDVCGETWYLDDPDTVAEALLVVWNAAKTAVDETQHRLGSLEAFVSSRLGAHRCEACDLWGDDLVEVDGIRACADHVGDVVADCDPETHPEAFDAVATWVDSTGIAESTDLESVVMWERLVSSSPALAALLGDVDDDAAMIRPVELHPLIAQRLGLDEHVRVGELANRLAAMLETDVPTTRIGVSFLLSILWAAVTAEDAPSLEAAAVTIVDRATPVYEANRMTVAVDICGHGMPDGTTFLASLANQVLTMVARRAALQLLTVLHQPTN